MTDEQTSSSKDKPTRADLGEVVGGGYIILRRGKDGRLGVGRRGRDVAHWRPFEHPHSESAEREARRLSLLHPGVKVCVFKQVFVAFAGPSKIEEEPA